LEATPMSDQSNPNPKKVGELAQQIVAILIESDQGTHDHADLGSFFNRGGDLKPSDYAFLCVAYHFSLYGTAAFSLGELRNIAMEAGIVIPDRLDMTMHNAAKNGKKLFQSAGRGSFRPTAAAGLFFAERWSVKPGKLRKAATGLHEAGAANAEA
jgi:hypothetical protein